MTINAKDFYTQITVPVLEVLENIAGIQYTPFDACLLMATSAQESGFGTFLDEDGGPALGIFQIIPSSLSDVVSKLTTPQQAAVATFGVPASVITNLSYAAAICRLYYLQRNTITPPATENITLASLWSAYKTFWNTNAGAATLSEFTQNFKYTGITLPAQSTQSSAKMLIMPGGHVLFPGVTP